MLSKNEVTIVNANFDISGSFVIPETINGFPVTMIGDFAFEECQNLTAITIPEGVTSIGSSAFFKCRNLEALTLPGTIRDIGRSAFNQCESLQSVNIPTGVSEIKDTTFAGCRSFLEVTLPTSVAEIGSGAFVSCRSLSEVTISGHLMQIGELTFRGCGELEQITFLSSAPKIVRSRTFDNVPNPGLEVFVTPDHAASFGGDGDRWNRLPVKIIGDVPQPIKTIGTSHSQGFFTVQFTGKAAVTNWKITGSSGLKNYDGDLSAQSVITETSSGTYEAVIDLTGKPARYFLRVGN